jgi:hypothetical protein
MGGKVPNSRAGVGRFVVRVTELQRSVYPLSFRSLTRYTIGVGELDVKQRSIAKSREG